MRVSLALPGDGDRESVARDSFAGGEYVNADRCGESRATAPNHGDV